MALNGKLKHPKATIIFFVVAFAAIGFAYTFVPALIRSRAERAELSTPAGIEAAVTRDPRTAPMFATMRQTHPEELEGITRQMAASIAGGASNAEITAGGRRAVRAAIARHYDTMLQAPATDLDAYRETQTAILTALQAKSPSACATYATTGELAENLIPPGMEQLIHAQEILFWKTAAAGRDQPARRTVGPLKQTDADALAAAMRADGISQTDLATFYDEQALARAAPARQCATFLHLLRGIRTLPDPARADATALTFARDR